MSENSSVRSPLVKALKSLDATPIESHIKAGIPDVNFIGGWIECKYRPTWPKRDIPVKFQHPLGVAQKVWLRRRVRKGGCAVLCAKVAQTWFFWNCATFDLDQFGHLTRDQMFETADVFSTRGPNPKVLIPWLKTISN